MALEKIYEITTTDRANDAVVLSLFQDLGSPPASVKVLPLSTRSREVDYQFSNGEGKGVLSYSFTMQLFADSDLIDVFTSEDIIRLEVKRDGNDLFTGTYNYSSLRKEYDPNLGRNIIQVSFVDGMSRLKNVSTKRYPFTGGGEIGLYGLIFIEMLPIMGYSPDRGGLFHRWESAAWIPSGVNIKQQFLEMRINYNLFTGETYAQIMQTLCESFNFVIGNSISGTDVRLILYSAGSTGSNIVGQLVNAGSYTDQTLTIPNYTDKVAVGSETERLRRLGLISANIRGDTPNAEISVTGVLGYNYEEFDYELKFDPQVSALDQIYGVSVRGTGGTYVRAQEFDQVDPANLATTFDLDAALVFDIGQYRQTNNDVFSGVIRDRVDPMIPFILDGKVYRMVRGSYNYIDIETNVTRAVQIGVIP